MDSFTQQASINLTLQALFKHLSELLPQLLWDELCDVLPKEWHLKQKMSELDLTLFEKGKQLALANQQLTEVEEPRLYSLFEEVRLSSTLKADKHFPFYYEQWYLSPTAIFPESDAKTAPMYPLTLEEKENRYWKSFCSHLALFVAQVKDIPSSHFHNLSLWLDHFDSLLQHYFSHVACPYDQRIAYYDYVKIATAFYVCLSFSEQENENILLVQGDFFGIQDFIFAGGGETNKQAAKLLRGRSFQVSLFTELAALKILQACHLSSFNQIMNAAGKFLIIAPNINEMRSQIASVQNELNQWFIQHTYGLAGIGIALQPVNQQQFIDSNLFKELMNKLFSQLEEVKLKRFHLTDQNMSVQNVDYSHGACRVNRYFPALTPYDEKEKESGLSAISLDQISIGKLLATKDRLIVCDYDTQIYQDYRTRALRLNIFDYCILFTDDANSTGDFNKLTKSQKIHRFWDFSLPKEIGCCFLWKGYAKRYINAYIPYFNDSGVADNNKYCNIDESNREYHQGEIKTFDYIACEDRWANAEYKYQGQTALMTLKGDIDNLGMIFQKGIEKSNFAKTAALSRQINQFFSLWLPAFCAEKYPNTYTVFAGGDDFFLIGPWYSIQKLAGDMQRHFKAYVAHNAEIHFSIGMAMAKVGLPVPQLSALAENALDTAKNSGKNSVAIYNQVIPWNEWKTITVIEEEIVQLAEKYHISTSYLYSLIFLVEQAEKEEKNKDIESALWRSQFYYRTARYVIDKLKKEQKNIALNEISRLALSIDNYQAKFTIPLFNYLYHQR